MQFKISRKGEPGMWHNRYINHVYNSALAETNDSVLLEIEEGNLWLDKHYIDMRKDDNSSWVSGVKYRTESCALGAEYRTKEETARPISPEEDAILRNPLLMDMGKTFERCLFTAIAKNNDYGGSDNDPFANFRNSTIAGVSVEKGILVRLMDKMSRVSTLLEKEAMVKDEAIIDTIEDAINYLAILGSYLKQNK